jgi:thiamine-phosphate pyrophosphorylase
LPPSPRLPGSPSRLSLARLYAIVDVELCAAGEHAPIDVVRAFLSAGVRLIQLRAKTWESGAFLDLAQAAVADANQAGALLIVNDRADVAAISEAHGLHVGQEDLSPADARLVVGGAACLGLSTHTEPQWTAALSAPISYMAIGPVFGTGTKATGYQPVGLETVSRVAAAAADCAMPVVAIGGITVDRAPAVIAAGASSVAVISDLMGKSPEARARAFIAALT